MSVKAIFRKSQFTFALINITFKYSVVYNYITRKSIRKVDIKNLLDQILKKNQMEFGENFLKAFVFH